MTSPDKQRWAEANARHLEAAVVYIRVLLAEHVRAARGQGPEPPQSQPSSRRSWFGRQRSSAVRKPPVIFSPAEPSSDRQWEICCAIAAEMHAIGMAPAIEELAARCGLSPFEQKVVLLCLAHQLEPSVGPMCGMLQSHCSFPTFALALRLFGPADGVALSPAGALRSLELIRLVPTDVANILHCELQLSESVLHFLRGVAAWDKALEPYLSPLPSLPYDLFPTEHALAADIVHFVRCGSATSPACVQLIGARISVRRIARAVASTLCVGLFEAENEVWRGAAVESAAALRRWRRDSTLFSWGLLLDGFEAPASDGAESERRIEQWAAHNAGLVVLAVPERYALGDIEHRAWQVPAPSVDEQAEAWRHLLKGHINANDPLPAQLARQFSIEPQGMVQVLVEASARDSDACTEDRESTGEGDTWPLGERLWARCREYTAPRLAGLAQRLTSNATFDDLVVAPTQRAQLDQLIAHVRYRWRVYDEWRVREVIDRGLGVSALFAGESGTGKTMAAEVIANELKLDLYRIDLASVIDKYVGETEKHLRRLFDEFEASGAILFFDECDALFGKRSEVRDSHDRYANIEVSYLLQRLESYRGLSILATNHRSALDCAFVRRLRFILPFDMPGEVQRRQIWQRWLVPGKRPRLRLPVDWIDFARLARFQFSGGSIQNIVLHAAFYAAGRGEHSRVTMQDLLTAARSELTKLERAVNEADFVWHEPQQEAVA